MKTLCLTVALICSSLNAQTVFLEESFESGIFPPTDWTEQSHANSVGWEDSLQGSAFHDDFVGPQDSRIISPSMDLSLHSEVYVHLQHSSQWTNYRYYNLIEVSLDGGLSFKRYRNVKKTGDFENSLLNGNMSAFAGLADVKLAFRYVGDFSNEWTLEKVRVDDVFQPDNPRWPNIPTMPILADGFVEDFESLAGQIPSHMALNSVDENTRFFDSNAWCNIGQLATNMHANGSYSLEMGIAPNYLFDWYYSNAAVFFFDGTNSGKLWIEMSVMNHGEELDDDDGIFLSSDGITWEPILEDWDLATGGLENYGTWQTVRTLITSYAADTSGLFYLAICQSDNRPYGQSDGLAVDDIRIFSEPLIAGFGQGAGLYGGVDITHCQPNSPVALMYSKVGPGPTDSIYGTLDLSFPVLNIGTFQADASGQVRVDGVLPPWLAGMAIWVQSAMTWDGLAVVSNSLAVQY